MAFATIVVATPLVIRLYRGSWPPWSALRWALLGGVLFAADLSTWATGVVLSGATNPTLLANTAPLWVGLGALVIFRQRLTSAFWVGTLVALIGAGLVLGVESSGKVVGSLLGLLAAVFYAGYFLVTQLGRQKLDALSYFWFAALTSATLLLLLSWGTNQPLTGYPATTYLTFIAMGVVSQVMGYFSVGFALGYLPASIVAPTLLGQPVITAVLAGVLLGEAFGPVQILGGAAVLAGVLVVVRSQELSGP